MIPEIFLLFNSQMKRHFGMYGDMASFDLTFLMIKGENFSGLRWKLGCFIGLSSARHIVPLGLILTLKETQEVYTRIFRTFFEAVGGCPAVIVAD
jgi:hypothetical protein